MKINYRRIGRHFRAARQQQNLKQKDIAELLGVSVKTYSNMERGAQELSLYRIIQLCLLLKLKPGYVLDDCSDDLLALETLPETVCDAKIQLMLLSRKCSDETHNRSIPLTNCFIRFWNQKAKDSIFSNNSSSAASTPMHLRLYKSEEC